MICALPQPPRYGSPAERIRQEVEKRLQLELVKKAAYRQKKARKWPAIADKISDPRMLVAGLSYYVHILQPAGKRFDWEPILATHRALRKIRRSWNPHLQAARTILCVSANRYNKTFWLPKNYAVRLYRILRMDVSDLRHVGDALELDHWVDGVVNGHSHLLDDARQFLLKPVLAPVPSAPDPSADQPRAVAPIVPVSPAAKGPEPEAENFPFWAFQP